MKRLLSLLALLLSVTPAAAQYTVVTICGTPPATLKVGQVITGFIDINGNACTNSSGGGGGGGGSVTQGTTPWVVSANGGTFAVTQSGTWSLQPTPATTGGMSVFTKQVANNTTSFAVDASAGTLYSIYASNNSGTIAYLKLYNTAQGSVTCGTPTPVDRLLIPANTNGAGFILNVPLGVAYGTAITACVTTGYADNDTGAPAASTYLLSFYYK